MLHGLRPYRPAGRLPWRSGSSLIGPARPGITGGTRVRVGLLAAVLSALALMSSAASASASQLLYFGGPVVHSANLVFVEWGPDTRPTYTNPTTGDPAFFRYLSSQDGSTSDIGGVLAQYMDRSGHNSQNRFTFLRAFQITPTVAPSPPGTVTDAQIQSNLQSQINARKLPAPRGNGLTTIYVVLFPPNDDVCLTSSSSTCAFNGGGFCAYHGSFKMSGSSTQILYAPIVDNGPGTPNYGGCGGNGATDLGRETSVIGHEMSEAINDPLNQVASWYDYNFNGEIADKCDAQPVARNGPWTVEPLWSNRDKRCVAGESTYRAPTASFLAPSTGTAGQHITFNAGTSSDPQGNTAAAMDQSTARRYSISSGIVSYRWNWGDGSPATTSANASAKHTFTQSGNYQVSLTVTDALGFTSTKTQQISVSGGSPGTPVVNTTAATALSDRRATLNGTVNPEGQTVTYHFAYGTAPGSLTRSTSDTPGPTGSSAMPVSASLSGLPASTRYYYELVVSASAGPYTGGVQNFKTSSSPPPPPKPVVATGAAQTVSASGARLTGTINPDGLTVSYYFRYGTTSLNHTTGVTSGLSGSSAVPVNATVTGLSPGTAYSYQLVVRVSSSSTYAGAVKRFTTARPLSNVITGPASNVTNNSAEVSGQLNPRGTKTIYQAQFGPTKHYGFSTTWITGGSGTSYEHVSLVLFGLHPSTTYHYRLVAQTNHGTTVGADRTFTTTASSAPAPKFHLTVASHMSWSRLLSKPLPIRFGASGRCTAHFMLVAEPSGSLRGAVLPTTLGRGDAELRKAGSGITTVTLLSRLRGRLRQAAARPSRVLLMGYAAAPGGLASQPQEAVITLSG